MKIFQQNFDHLRIRLASPENIMKWCHHFLPTGEFIGEVTKPITINYRTLKPFTNGLFCERIFGPIKNWECQCGQYNHKQYNGIYCESCGVQIIRSTKRRYQMGYINLLHPVIHIWYLKSIPNLLSIILNKPNKELENIIYFQNFSEKNLNYGADYIQHLLKRLNLSKEIANDRENILNLDLTKKSRINYRQKCLKRIRLLESFVTTKSKPEWMILTILPILPPGLRPMMELINGKVSTTDINELYTKVIARNLRLLDTSYVYAPKLMRKNEKRILQESVDNLIDNKKSQNKALDKFKRPLQCLSDVLKGKHGRFRQNLLGKRVDYSGRSVIIVDPTLNLNNCGLPLEIALELFKPFIIRAIVSKGFSGNFIAAKIFMKNNPQYVIKILKNLLIDHPIFLNRAPTLHRLGIQAFEPILINGRAIKLHPLVCSAFNADFDGDQMAVHLPLSLEAQAEAYLLMLSPYNFLSLATGEPIMIPTQDMVLGCYYLTLNNIKNLRGSYHYFSNFEDAILAYKNNIIDLHSIIWVRYNKKMKFSLKLFTTISSFDDTLINKYEILQQKINNKGELDTQYLKTTVGRIIFNSTIIKSFSS